MGFELPFYAMNDWPFKAMRELLWTFALSMVLAASVPAYAATCDGVDASALAWIDKMARNSDQHSYHGVVTLQRGDQMQVMQVAHQVKDGATTGRLTQLNGQGAQVERINHPVNCQHPGHQVLALGADVRSGRCDIARQYHFSIAGDERIAGRRAVKLRVVPKDMYRFGYLMSLDRETGLLLKTELIGRGDRILEKYQFANLAYDDVGTEVSEVSLVHRAEHPHPQHNVVHGQVAYPWSVGWLPRGFIATDTSHGRSDRRTFTDGLAVFSVFLETLDQRLEPGEGVVRSGGTTSYTRGMSIAGQSVLVTVIGEVPVNTARMVADSVVWVQ